MLASVENVPMRAEFSQKRGLYAEDAEIAEGAED
jgi:hypothetical protein